MGIFEEWAKEHGYPLRKPPEKESYELQAKKLAGQIVDLSDETGRPTSHILNDLEFIIQRKTYITY